MMSSVTLMMKSHVIGRYLNSSFVLFYPKNPEQKANSMSNYSTELYRNLMLICSTNPAFYYKDLLLDEIPYRIFNYRLCSYEQFYENPFALNCRGTMFDLSDDHCPKLVCLPPEKFFNYEEGNGLVKHRTGRLNLQMDKLDGSLISTYLHRSSLKLKSKTSFNSSQAIQSMELFQGLGQIKEDIERLVHLGYTVNMEYTSPLNPIVIHYSQPKLTILSIRSHHDGQTFYADRLHKFLQENHFTSMIESLVPFQMINNQHSHEEYLNKVHQQLEGEGFVVEISHSNAPSYLVKIKTNRYSTLHQTLTNVTSSKYLFHSILHELTDDLKPLLVNNLFVSEKLRRMESFIQPIYNKFLQSIEAFYQENRHLTRKDFALAVNQNGSMKHFLALLMNLYQGKENDYQKFAHDRPKLVFNVSLEYFDSEEFLQGIISG